MPISSANATLITSVNRAHSLDEEEEEEEEEEKEKRRERTREKRNAFSSEIFGVYVFSFIRRNAIKISFCIYSKLNKHFNFLSYRM